MANPVNDAKLMTKTLRPRFSSAGWRGEISGRIDTSGRLIGSGYADAGRVSGWGSSSVAVLRFTAEYENGAFRAEIPASGAGSNLMFSVTLTRLN